MQFKGNVCLVIDMKLAFNINMIESTKKKGISYPLQVLSFKDSCLDLFYFSSRSALLYSVFKYQMIQLQLKVSRIVLPHLYSFLSYPALCMQLQTMHSRNDSRRRRSNFVYQV